MINFSLLLDCCSLFYCVCVCVCARGFYANIYMKKKNSFVSQAWYLYICGNFAQEEKVSQRVPHTQKHKKQQSFV